MSDRDTLAAMAAATPSSRHRSIDFLRVASILVIVIGHQLIAVLGYHDGSFTGVNLLEIAPRYRVATWLFQVVPIFFLVGGYTNAASWASAKRRGVGYVGWLRARAARLLRPALVFVAVWTVIPFVVVALGLLPSSVARLGGQEVSLPLWFLASYLLVVAAAPALLAVHARFGVGVFVLLALGVVVVDAVQYGLDVWQVGLANHLLVWLAIVELGILWRDGSLDARPATAWLLLGGGLLGLVAVTSVGGYPVSMIHLAHLPRSNAFPPSVAMLLLGVAQCGLVLLIDDALNGWLQRERVWRGVIGANAMVMTFYLWNMTAVVVAAVLVFPTGIAPQPDPLSDTWWALRPAWVALCFVCLVPLLLAFRWAERPGPPPLDAPGAGAVARSVAGVVLAAAGFGYLAVHAFPVPHEELLWPTVGVASLVVGSALLRVGVPLPRRRTLDG
jgi:hypothetical protein